jgi:hypothetical protein
MRTIFVVLVNGTPAHAEALREETAAVLRPMSLRPSEGKTRIVHVDEGFDFLGFRIRRAPKRGSGELTVYTYPSRGALASVKAKVRAATQEATNQPLATLCRLSPMVRGWVNYFRHGVSKATFDDLREFTWRRSSLALASQACATTSRTSTSSNATPSGTLPGIRSLAAWAASSDSNTIMESPVFSLRVSPLKEAWYLQDLRHDLISQGGQSSVLLTDPDPDDDCMHDAPSVAGMGRSARRIAATCPISTVRPVPPVRGARPPGTARVHGDITLWEPRSASPPTISTTPSGPATCRPAATGRHSVLFLACGVSAEVPLLGTTLGRTMLNGGRERSGVMHFP